MVGQQTRRKGREATEATGGPPGRKADPKLDRDPGRRGGIEERTEETNKECEAEISERSRNALHGDPGKMGQCRNGVEIWHPLREWGSRMRANLLI